ARGFRAASAGGRRARVRAAAGRFGRRSRSPRQAREGPGSRRAGEPMPVFDDSAFDDHERVLFCRDAATGLRAVIAIHSTALGPAAGGCRLWRYASEQDAIHDVLRLSQGMSYKNAMAGLAFGGGKAVILKGEDFDGSPALFERFGEFVDSLGGRYITAEDVGMSVETMEIVARRTRFVTGLSKKEGHAGGDPS